jgi:hypothetical protein
MHRLYHHEGRSSMGILQGDRQRVLEQTNAVADCKSLLESKYLQYCSPSIPFQRTTLGIGQIVLAKQSLMAQYPLFHSSSRSAPISKDLRDELFETSCTILELTDRLVNDPETSSWTWMLQTYVHWHPVAFLLNELCTAPQHPQSARAWGAIEKTLENPHGLTPEANQALWRPLRGLLERAKAMTWHVSPEMFHENAATTPELFGESFTVPSTAAFDVPAQQLSNMPMFIPCESIAPPDDSRMAVDLLTPFATMTDFMTDKLNDPWWIDNDLTMPNGTGS